MTRGRIGTAIVSALLIAWFSGLARAAVIVEAGSQSTKRVVVMAITIPKKGVPPIIVSTPEGETATLSLDGIGKIGFEPTFRKSDGSTVIVTLFDVANSPSQKLGETAVPVAGKPVQSKTSPSFGIQIVRVTQPK
jgi:uncharacterized lipoprotein YbaY